MLRRDAPTAVSEMEADKDGVRLGLDMPTLDVITSPKFLQPCDCGDHDRSSLSCGVSYEN